MKFDKYPINRKLKSNLAKLGWNKPTDIQYKSIAPILDGNDVLGVAQTGTGKTAAFAIPIVELILRSKQLRTIQSPLALIIVPTRELATQVHEVFVKVCKGLKVNPIVIHGGVEQDHQINQLLQGVDIVISTPGRMFDLSSQGYLDLRMIRHLVLDEADHMLDLGFIDDIRDLVERLPKKRQTLFFSATIDKKIKQLAYSLVVNPIRIQISPKNPVAKNIEHSKFRVEMDDKRYFLERVINENPDKKMLVFVRTKVRAERVCKALERLDINSKTLHGDKDQALRFQELEGFKNDEFNVLIATDVSARGIDIPGIHYVVNYDIPEQAENYVHRVGRTGRAGKKGYAVSFYSSKEEELVQNIEEYIGDAIEEIFVEKEDYQQIKIESAESHSDWKSLLKEDEKLQQEIKKIQKKRRKKK